MSEKIIIDGVNVAECSYYNEENKPYCCEIWDNECEAQNCYFKQLQRLKQENEELKKRCEDWAMETVKTQGIIDGCEIKIERLKQENKKLKEYKNEAKIEYENLLINRNDFAERAEKLEQENKELKEDINKRTHCISCQRELENCRLSITNAKYKQALEEIREVLARIDFLSDLDFCCSSAELSENFISKLDKARIISIQKINEVLND